LDAALVALAAKLLLETVPPLLLAVALWILEAAVFVIGVFAMILLFKIYYSKFMVDRKREKENYP